MWKTRNRPKHDPHERPNSPSSSYMLTMPWKILPCMWYDTRWPLKGEVSLCECHYGIRKSGGIVHHSYLTSPLGEVNHQLHTLSVSLLLPTEEMTGWATELVWKLRRKGKPLATAGKQMVTQLSSLQPSHYYKCANLTPSGYLFYII